MPQIANITVKKADGTTDIVYNALAGAGGDKSPAMFRQDTGAPVDLPQGHRPTLEVKSMSNGPKTARRVEGLYKAPYAILSTDTNSYMSKDKVVISFTATVPEAIPAALVDEFTAQALNLFASALIKESVRVGFAPT